ncbi:glycosyltransferase [Rhodococcus sp. BP-349]|uniref:glycosyltransferase n=1 Tax=unclassified Rhodococcus (in: high G+C Gram-positive bacteria) TaxID=192944 RepID=UPI001C9B0B8D|nr:MULTISPECIES: glycosyltransferase [unclassified Rhodococcus (in: high G+C Gram-positive bacteria)]MBY6539472.1 glycosyltransferase [Rhodococcus sp. BP-363]MBY6544200.1 glycosyltransferase [Rhodococcus sp. BP-369]MBY6563430.1 glycosyltransferase [Rhodococcus sp. BP-370]MBY6577722.1 glycosyltransferase [Rhodococcus sp. BP-364]MBY6587023.1 glycosyltransferase [Rhodococcus sp. BP-358]
MTAPRPIVVFASMYYDGHQLYDQRLARALATQSQVLYVEPPTSVLRRARHSSRNPGLRRSSTSDEMRVLTPATIPFGGRAGVQHLTAVLLVLQVWLAAMLVLRTARFDVIYIAIKPLAKVFFPSRRSVSLVKDDYAAGSALTGLSASAVLRNFRRSMRRARHVVVVSPTLRTTMFARGLRATVVPAGCDVPATVHAEPTDLADVQRPRLVFVGMVSDRIDLDLLEAATAAGFSLVMVGETQPTFSKGEQYDRLRSSPRTHVLSPRSGSDLDAVIQHCDVGLIPYELSEFNRSSFPLKAFEYLACGVPVVSTALPSMVWLDFRHLHVASTVDQFLSHIDRAVTESTTEVIAEECRTFAGKNTWSQRAEVFRRLLEES